MYPLYLRNIYKINIGKETRISWKAIIDKNINPKGIFIGNETIIGRVVMILAHDVCKGIKSNTIMANRCFIGVPSILPWVTLGDEVIVGAGSLVTKSFPSNCIIAGNPAKIIKENIHCSNYGKLRQI